MSVTSHHEEEYKYIPGQFGVDFLWIWSGFGVDSLWIFARLTDYLSVKVSVIYETSPKTPGNKASDAIFPSRFTSRCLQVGVHFGGVDLGGFGVSLGSILVDDLHVHLKSAAMCFKPG